MADGNDTGRRVLVQQGQTEGTGQRELTPRNILHANFAVAPEEDPPGTAFGLTRTTTKEHGLDVTFAGWPQSRGEVTTTLTSGEVTTTLTGGEVTTILTGPLTSNLVEEYVQSRVMPLKLENARLKSKLNDLEEHWVRPEEFEELRSRLEELEEGRILRFRLPAGYLDEEPEEM